jgi:DNA-binding transcriptional MerR regulator
MKRVKKWFNSGEVQKLAGITWRQLNYWTSTGFFTPAGGAPSGKGYRLRFSFNNIVEVAALMRLRTSGISLQQLRAVKKVLDSLDISVPFCCLVVAGDDVLAVTDKDDLISVLTRPGQHAFRAVDVSAVAREVKAAVERMVDVA